MKLDNFSKANELRQKIEYLDEKIDSLVAIKEQVASPHSTAGLELIFFSLRYYVNKTSFDVYGEEMRFIIDHVIEFWKKRKNELETEFEQL